MICMDVDTALGEVPVNVAPLIDDTDFKSIETGVAYNASGMALNWHFVTPGGAYTVTAVTPTTGGNYDWAHQGQGMYSIEIPASGGASINNDTEGFGWFTGFATGVLPWRGPTICFRAAGLNDALVESAYSTTRGLAGTALPNAAAEASGGLPTLSAAQASNGTINANVHRWLTGTPNALQSGRVDSYIGAVAAGVIAAASFAANALDAVWSATSRTLSAFGFSVTASTVSDKTGYALTSAYDAAKTAASQTSVDDLPTNSELATALGGADDAVLAAVADVQTTVDAIQERTDNLPDDPADESLIIAATDAIVAILGALNTSASSGDVGTSTTIVAYLKQLVNTLEGTPGIPTWPAGAAPGNAVSIAEALRHLYTQVGTAGAGLTEAGGTGDQFTAIPWNAAWDAEVQSEVEDALTAARSESASVPAANASLVDKVRWLATIARNKVTNDGTNQKVYADDATTVVGTASVGESAGTVTRGEYA